jgi:hypothetical protein
MKMPEPILEWFSICCLGKLPVKQLSIRKYFLFPLPILIAYILLSLYPNFLWVVHGENTHWFKSAVNCPPRDNFYLKNCYLRYNLIWFVLTGYAIYTVLIYKNRFYLLLNDLKDKNVINDDIYKEAKNSLFSNKSFFIFLGLFEIFFYIWWQPNDIAGIFIAVVVLPTGAQIFSAFLAGATLPIILSKRARVNIFDADKRGGLKPISDLLIVLTSIYFVGILMSYIMYPSFYTMPKAFPFFGLVFIVLGVFIFFVPQIYIHRLLAREKTSLIRYVQGKISYLIKEIIEIEGTKKESQDKDLFQNRLSSFQNIRSEIDRMGTWPFDLNIIKFLFTLSITIIIPAVVTYSNKPLTFGDIIDFINKILTATPHG